MKERRGGVWDWGNWCSNGDVHVYGWLDSLVCLKSRLHPARGVVLMDKKHARTRVMGVELITTELLGLALWGVGSFSFEIQARFLFAEFTKSQQLSRFRRKPVKLFD